MSYNSTPDVKTIASALADNANLKGQIWSNLLLRGAEQFNDLARLKGPDGSDKPIYVKTELTKDGGDKVNFTVMGGLSGPGVIGEQELTGNTSKPQFGMFQVVVDFHRDGFELTKKLIKFLAAGKGVVVNAKDMLAKKLGLKQQRASLLALRQKNVGTTIRPNFRANRDALRKGDTFTPDVAVSASGFAKRNGAKPISLGKSGEGSVIPRYLVFATDTAMADVRANETFQLAQQNAGVRGDANPLFTGRLVDWQNLGWFEHHVIDPDADDTVGSPLAPRMVSAEAFGADTPNPVTALSDASTVCRIRGSATNLLNLYAQDFPGYRYKWWDGVSDGSDGSIVPADTNYYYAWGFTPEGRVGFVRYTGSTGNNGNSIKLSQILASAAGTSTIGSKTVGLLNVGASAATDSGTRIITPGGTGNNIPAGDYVLTDYFPAGTVFFPANAAGVLVGHSFVFGRGALCHANGSISGLPTEEMRDFGFVQGFGFEAIFGMAPYVSAVSKKTTGYALVEHAIEHDGYSFPALAT
jgi:hypothetical protein